MSWTVQLIRWHQKKNLKKQTLTCKRFIIGLTTLTWSHNDMNLVTRWHLEDTRPSFRANCPRIWEVFETQLAISYVDQCGHERSLANIWFLFQRLNKQRKLIKKWLRNSKKKTVYQISGKLYASVRCLRPMPSSLVTKLWWATGGTR